jgi:capsid protein
LHLYLPDRFSQRRGISCLAPCSQTVGMHDDVQFATLVKAQAAAIIAILHERGPNWEPQGNSGFGPQSQQPDANASAGYTRNISGYSAGLEVFGDPDEKLNMSSPNIPSPEFFPHTMLLLTFIAINLDIPVHVLLLDPSRTNFSGWRGAIEQARLRFRQLQAWMIGKFHSPVFRWWLRRQLLTNRRLAELAKQPGVNIFKHLWNPPQFPYIEPLVDANADDLQATRFLNSRRRLQAARGREFSEIRDESLDDNASMITGAIERANVINEKFPEAKVNWREIISVPMADKATATLPLIGESQGGTKKEDSPGNGNGGSNDQSGNGGNQ